MHIDHAIALVAADAARLDRYVERRERFLDGLLEADMAEVSSYIMHLMALAADGVSELAAVVRFAPFPRPWHSAWKTLSN